jgi:L-amino acid N-acyltransferase YncA
VSEVAEQDDTAAPDVALRLGTEADVPTVARIHLDHMDMGFVRTLGYGFLKSMYLRIVRSEHGFMIVAEQPDGRIIGYTTGSTDTGKLWREFVIRDGVRAGLAALPKVVRHPGRILETRRYPKAAASEDLPAAEWLTIAVDPTVRYRGLGMKLTTRLMEEFVARGTPAVRGVGVTWNDPIFKLLIAHGYEDVGMIQVHSGTDSRVLVWHNPDLQG